IHSPISHLVPYYLHVPHRALPSFPTRRSSDLNARFSLDSRATRETSSISAPARSMVAGTHHRPSTPGTGWARSRSSSSSTRQWRSEEHTSELQSRENLVCRLLLEKKKIIPKG